jgi:hypothetical protein
VGKFVNIKDEATPFIKRVAKETPKYIDRVIQSTGKMMKKEIQAGIESGAPGGQSYQEFSGLPKLTRQRKGGFVRVRRRANKKPLGRLKQAVRYKMYKDSHRVIIGWISKSAEELGTIHETGKMVAITPKMRRLFFAAGIGLSNGKSQIAIPRRPTIGPEYEENAPKIPGYIERKLWSYINEGGRK